MKEKIALASDHGGFNLKNEILEYLLKKGYEVSDFGTYENVSCDYPVYAKKVCENVLNGKFNKGILVCGTGLGMQIAANRFRGIRAVCPENTFSAKMSRAHNNSNVLTLGERVLGKGLALEMLNAEFEGGRHQKRIDMLEIE